MYFMDALPPSGVKTACQVASFKLMFKKWNISWPGYISNDTTIRLPVSFRLELAEGSDSSQCNIRQRKRGLVKTGAGIDFESRTWHWDGPLGHTDWWDGADWWAGSGSWGWIHPRVATFEDEPGFNDDEGPYPLYWGGVGHAGHFEFETIVWDVATGYTIRAIKWGMLLDFKVPGDGKGRCFFYK